MPHQTIVQVAPVLAAKAIGSGVLALQRSQREACVYWAEDSLDDQYLIRQALPAGDSGMKVDFFLEGKALLDAVERRRPDLVVLDLKMDGMDGLSTLRALRTGHAASQVPVVMFSTARDEAEERACRRLGVLAYVQKPVKFEEFSAAVQRILAWSEA